METKQQQNGNFLTSLYLFLNKTYSISVIKYIRCAIRQSSANTAELW